MNRIVRIHPTTLGSLTMFYRSAHFDHMRCWVVIIDAEICLKNRYHSINNHMVEIEGERRVVTKIKYVFTHIYRYLIDLKNIFFLLDGK